MSTNGALAEGQRKKIQSSGNLHFNAVAHLSKVFQIIKHLPLIKNPPTAEEPFVIKTNFNKIPKQQS